MTSSSTSRVVLLALVALSCLASVSGLDQPSSKPKQSIGKYATLFLKPSKAEVDVDAYAFVIPVSRMLQLATFRSSPMHQRSGATTDSQ